MKAVYLQKCNTWKTESLKNTSISYFNLPVFLISFFFFFPYEVFKILSALAFKLNMDWID